MYPSRCDVSATQKDVFGHTGNGHIDDYYFCTYNPQTCPLNYSKDPYYEDSDRPTHPDDCIADFVGNSIRKWRNNNDGSTSVLPVGGTAWTTGVKSKWIPPSYCTWDAVQQEPILPCDLRYGYANYNAGANRLIDAAWGLAQYVAVHAGYSGYTGHATNQDQFSDIADYYVQVIRGYFDSNTDGVEESDTVAEIDAGRPVIGLLNKMTLQGSPSVYMDSATQHAVVVFGYIPGSPLKLLVYDTWNEYCLTDPGNGLPYENTTYRVVDFPTRAQVKRNSGNGYFSFIRKSTVGSTANPDGEHWKVWSFAFLTVNSDARCPDPIGPTEYPSGDFTGQFNISFTGLPASSRVYYEFGSKDPSPASQYVLIDQNGEGTLAVNEPCAVSLRTYAPDDGYLASGVVRRIYQSQPKEAEDDDAAGAISMVVTHVVDDDTFYCEQWETRALGIRVHKTGHGLGLGDWLDTVSGTMGTTSGTGQASCGERFIQATGLTQAANRRARVEPFCTSNRCVGGGDWNYDSESGAGQQGITDGVGLNNIGLLLKTTGCVCSHSTSSFEITDGSPQPITIITPSGMDPLESGYVGVTGVCSRQSDGNGGYKPVLLVRSTNDIQVYSESCAESGSGSRFISCAADGIRSSPMQPDIIAACLMLRTSDPQTDCSA